MQITDINTNEKIRENRTTESFKQLFKISLNWGFISLIIITSLVASIWTLLPTAILPWGASKSNLIGYISHCSFSPVSSLMLLGAAGYGIFLASKKASRNPIGYIILAAATIATLIGILVIGIDLNLIFSTGLGIGVGIIGVLVFGLVRKK